MYAAKSGRDVNHRLYELVYVLRVDQNRHCRDVGELVVEDCLALHHRHRRHRPYITQAQHARAIRTNGDAAADHGELACERGVVGDGHGCPSHSRRVDVTHVLDRPHRLGRFDLELSALVLQESPVTVPQDLDTLQGVQKLRDALSPGVVAYFERYFAYGMVPSDVDRCHVPDQTIPLGYGPGDPGELAGAVRLLDAVSVVECHEINLL